MHNSSTYRIVLSIGILFALFVSANSAHAIPAFTRAHKVECTTCHTIYPELNEYGEAFLKNSYVYFGKSKKTDKKDTPAPQPAPAPAVQPATDGAATAPVIKGDGDADKLNKLKAGALGAGSSAPATATVPAAVPAATAPASDPNAEGILLAAIPEQLPISFTGTINYAYSRKTPVNDTVNDLDFSARSLKLHAGGNFREKVGFFGTYVAYSEQPPVGTYNTSKIPTNNATDINEVLLSWRHMFDTPFNLRLGRMQPKLGLWKTNNKLMVTNSYLPYSYTVGDDSVFKIEQPQDALELNAVLGNRLYLAGGIVNRKGQNTKEGYGHISYKIGGADFLANEPEVDLNKEESILDFLTMTIGSYGYYGKNGTANSNDPKNTYYRIGADAEFLYKIFRLRFLGSYGDDDNVTPRLVNSWTHVISKAGTVEGELTLLINLLAAARFEYLQQEKGSGTGSFNNLYMRRYVGSLGYAPLENLKLSLEFKYELTQSIINRIGTLGAMFSF